VPNSGMAALLAAGRPRIVTVAGGGIEAGRAFYARAIRASDAPLDAAITGRHRIMRRVPQRVLIAGLFRYLRISSFDRVLAVFIEGLPAGGVGIAPQFVGRPDLRQRNPFQAAIERNGGAAHANSVDRHIVRE